MSNYTAFRIVCDPQHSEILLARLADAGFDSFLEEDWGMTAYADAARSEQWIKVISELKEDYPLTFSQEEVEDKNWNEAWEASFRPIRVGERLTIRASFHGADEGAERELVIDPRMAFGTGHHATTYMMCELMLDRHAAGRGADESVLDYGTGTGVLAILAKKLGAGRVDAVDIEAASVENTVDNAAENGVELDEIVHGVLDDVPDMQAYDLVLANINRNVLLDTGEALKLRLRSGGTALLSGILAQDERLLTAHFAALGFTLIRRMAREDWRAFEFKRE